MAKDRAYGSDAQMLGAFESSYGAFPTASFTQLLFASSTLGAGKPLGVDPLAGKGRDAQDPHYEGVTDDGEIVIPFDLRATGFWLKGLLGDPVTTDNLDGTWSHVFTSGADLPSLGLEIGHPKLTTPKFFRHPGTKLESLAFEMARTGPANATIAAVAQGEESQGATIDAAPASFALRRFNRSRGAIKVGGTQLGNVTGGRLTFSNNLDRVETIRPDQKIEGADETEATAEGEATVRFSADTTLDDAADGETPVAMTYEHTLAGAEGFHLTFELPRVFLAKVKAEISGPGGVERTHPWRAAFDDVAGHMLQVTLKNDVASY